MALHERLALLRAMVHELSNSELDRLCGLRKGHTWALERNKNANPELKTLQAIAQTFGVPVGYLASGEGNAPLRETIKSAVADARKKSEGKATVAPVADDEHKGAA